MNNNLLYVFHGYGGENSLLPLAAYMKERGFHTLVVDDQYAPLSRAETYRLLQDQKQVYSIVYITSAHLWFDEFNYDDFFWKDSAVISAIEMLDFLKPVYSVYYPHDLECFMHPSEMNWLDLFDHVMLPYINNDYYKLKTICPNVDIVGWIKKREEVSPAYTEGPSTYSPLFFPSNISSFYKILGVKGYADWFIKYISPSIPLKMPGTDPTLYQILTDHGFTFLDPSVTVYGAMSQYNLIIASGDSSIVFEAALSGLPVISILDGMMSDEMCLQHIGGIPGVYPVHPEELNNFIEDLNKNGRHLEHSPNILKPFDFEQVLRLLTNL